MYLTGDRYRQASIMLPGWFILWIENGLSLIPRAGVTRWQKQNVLAYDIHMKVFGKMAT